MKKQSSETMPTLLTKYPEIVLHFIKTMRNTANTFSAALAFLTLVREDFKARNISEKDNDINLAFDFLLKKTDQKVETLQRDEVKAFDRQVKQLEQLKKRADRQGDLKLVLEIIKETNKLIGLYNKEFFEQKQSKSDLVDIRNKVLSELEDSFGGFI